MEMLEPLNSISLMWIDWDKPREVVLMFLATSAPLSPSTTSSDNSTSNLDNGDEPLFSNTCFEVPRFNPWMILASLATLYYFFLRSVHEVPPVHKCKDIHLCDLIPGHVVFFRNSVEKLFPSPLARFNLLSFRLAFFWRSI